VLAAIADAAWSFDATLRPHVRMTPAVPWTTGSGPTRSIVLKLENLQVTGSFKFRGAMAKVTTLQRRGVERVVAASTGNHGLAVAQAAALCDMTAQVFVATGAAPTKVAAMQRLGADVVTVGTDPLEAELAARAAADGDGPYVSPYNDVDVVAGQGTVGTELVRELDGADAVYVAVGGGGLIAGVAAVLRTAWPATRIVGAYPARSPAMARSVEAGRIVDVPAQPTLSDGTAGGVEPGAITLPLCRELVHEWQAVDEDEIAATMRRVFDDERMLVEGAAAVALAAASRARDGRIVAVVCGGNVDRAVAAGVLGASLA
jgi:threonine dehydratase